jgi:propionyl-CoA carboxylase alpha chain
MPGTVTAVHVSVGDAVGPGQPLLVLEAVKLQHPVAAGDGGVVRSLGVVPGTQADAGTVLALTEGNANP